MANGYGSNERILAKLDEYLHKDDYASAERHLRYWLEDAERQQNFHTEILMRNELMGLYRKLGKKQEALTHADTALRRIDELELGEQIGAATTFLNCATVYKAFGMADRSLPLFERARTIYEAELSRDDPRLGGLYNNMGLTLVDLRRFDEAEQLYALALSVMERVEDGAPERAITYLNLASAAEARLGALEADEIIGAYLDRAEALLESHPTRDGAYAFVCEKCASVFGYYGRFLYENTLKERARRIYGHEGT